MSTTPLGQSLVVHQPGAAAEPGAAAVGLSPTSVKVAGASGQVFSGAAMANAAQAQALGSTSRPLIGEHALPQAESKRRAEQQPEPETPSPPPSDEGPDILEANLSKAEEGDAEEGVKEPAPKPAAAKPPANQPSALDKVTPLAEAESKEKDAVNAAAEQSAKAAAAKAAAEQEVADKRAAAASGPGLEAAAPSGRKVSDLNEQAREMAKDLQPAKNNPELVKKLLMTQAKHIRSEHKGDLKDERLKYLKRFFVCVLALAVFAAVTFFFPPAGLFMLLNTISMGLVLTVGALHSIAYYQGVGDEMHDEGKHAAELVKIAGENGHAFEEYKNFVNDLSKAYRKMTEEERTEQLKGRFKGLIKPSILPLRKQADHLDKDRAFSENIIYDPALYAYYKEYPDELGKHRDDHSKRNAMRKMIADDEVSLMRDYGYVPAEKNFETFLRNRLENLNIAAPRHEEPEDVDE